VKSTGKYLACFPTTNSELVVPIRHDGKPVGEIDIDSDKPGAFTKEDEEFVMQIGELIGEKVYSVYEP
ncbi:MAG: GAF domain-containing protein, partial [Candidatus Thermoplasmatota archaeon]|nr:GAF domain-containing protein [Candidatus Thermoplasmatota archaeon]